MILNSNIYDVAVVGGGLSGCFSAYHLAQAGLKVLVIEEHAVSGEPRHCTGIIGKEAFNRFNLPTLSIQNTLYSASFYSPLKNWARVSKTEPQAFIVNRSEFDQELAQNAVHAGARFRYSSRCTHLETEYDRIKLTLQTGKTSETVEARVGILSTGTFYGIHSRMNIDRPRLFLDTAQVEVDASGIREVELCFGRNIAPGSFGWASPISPNRARIGLSTYKNAGYYLTRFLASGHFSGRVPPQKFEVKRRVIPIRPLKKTYGRRFLIMGDAAGQVKPTTGGGIYYSLLSAYLASQNIVDAFKRDRFEESHFRLYQEQWKNEIGRELRIGAITRKLLRCLTDPQIDLLVRFLQDKEIIALIEKYADFDWHYNVIIALSRDPLVWRHIPRRLFNLKTEVAAKGGFLKNL